MELHSMYLVGYCSNCRCGFLIRSGGYVPHACPVQVRCDATPAVNGPAQLLGVLILDSSGAIIHADCSAARDIYDGRWEFCQYANAGYSEARTREILPPAVREYFDPAPQNPQCSAMN